MWRSTEEGHTPPWAQPWTTEDNEGEGAEPGTLHSGEHTRQIDSECCAIEIDGPSTSYERRRASSRYRSPSVASEHLYSFRAGAKAENPFAASGSKRRSEEEEAPVPFRDSCEPFVPSAPTLTPPTQGISSPTLPRRDVRLNLNSSGSNIGNLGRNGDSRRNSAEVAPYTLSLQTRESNESIPVESRRLLEKKARERSIGLNPLQENATLRLLTYEACLRLCFASAGRSSECKIFLDDGFQLLQSAFGVDKLVLQPLLKQNRKDRGAMSEPGPEGGRRQQQLNTSLHLNLEFSRMKSIGKKSASHGNMFLHSLGKKLRSSGRSKSLYCHVRLSSKANEDYHITKIGSHHAISLELFSSDSSSEGQNRYSAEDNLEIVLKDKQEVSIGYASMPISSTIDAEIHGTRQFHHLPVRSQQGNIVGSLEMISTIEKKVKKADSAVEDGLNSLNMEFDANRAYDLLLQVALSANNFKQRHLLITKPWHFLLNRFASEYNISTSTCILQFLKWVVRAATPTSECMDILCQLLPRVLKEKHQTDLPAAEQNMLSQILKNVEELLAKAFQCIKSLSEKESNGVLTGYQIVPKDMFPSKVIPKVLYLYSQMHDLLAPSSQKKLVMHLQAAANLRFGRIKRDAIDSCTGEQRMVGEGIDCLAASKIFDALRLELEYDKMLHESGLLPAFVNFPNISNDVYAEKLYEHLKELLVNNPPTDFSDALDSLFRSASLYETAQSKFSLGSPKDKSVFVLFSDHVETWIRRDCTWLVAKLTQKEISQEVSDIERALSNYHFGSHAESHLPHQSPYQLYMIPLFKSGGVFDKIQAFLNKYSGIVKRWPDWVPVLETSCCRILRDLLNSLNLACAAAKSSVILHQQKHTPVKMLRCKKTTNFSTRLSIAEVIMLNAQRQMLSFIPKLRSSVSNLSSGVPIQKDLFKNGTMFRHVEEEVRTSYAQATQKCVISLSEAPCHKLKKILKEQSKNKLNECEDNVRDLLKPYLTLIETILADHRAMLTPKVWRDLCRGMWDLAAAEVLNFMEQIVNQKENVNFHVRVMTSEVSSILEGFFQQGLHQVLGTDVHQRDLQTPASAKKLRERICGQNLSASDSFSVY